MSLSLSRRGFVTTGVAIGVGLAIPTRGEAAPDVLHGYCERLGGRLRVWWTINPKGAPVDIYVADTPDRQVLGERLAVHNRAGVFETSDPIKTRPYFRLVRAGKVLVTAERVLPLQGGRNFRDLGGYRAADGRTVRWGTMYRSGTMAGLTDADYTYLASLGISVICDFRSTAERAREPTVWQESPPPRIIARDYVLDSGGLEAAAKPNITAAGMRDAMIRSYADYPYVYADHYRDMFNELAAGRTPLAFHCSAGKDRTGVAAGLILSILNVPRSVILVDYSLSDKLVNYEALFSPAKAAPPLAEGFAFLAKLKPEIRAPLLRSDPVYLAAALMAVEKRDGSIKRYLENQLGIDAANIERIQSHLLET